MNNKRYHIPAFTILEVVFTMVITGVIMLMVYQIFGVAHRQLASYIQMQDDIINYEQFVTQFSVDVQQAQQLKDVTTTRLQLQIDGKEVEYAFAKAYTLRITETQDTLLIPVKTMQIDTVTTEGQGNLHITLETELLGNPITVFETRRLSLSTDINKRFLQ